MKKYIIVLCITSMILSCKKSKDSPPPPPPEPKDTLLNWKKLVVPAIGESFSINDNWFANTSTGVISTFQGIFKTTDGGNTWQKTLATGDYSNLFFLQPQIGFAQGRSLFAFTLNGGDSWSTKSITIASPRDIFFVSASTGFLAANSELYKTTDTGNTWNKVFNGSALTLFFLNNNEGFLYSAQKIYRTDNAGITWQPIGDIAASASVDDWYVLQFVDARNGMFCGRRTFAISTDGGVSWNQKEFNDKIYDIHFFSKDVGYLLTRSEIFKTTDGGISWTRSCKVAKESLIELYFIGPTTGWAVGNNGLLLQLQ